MRLRYHTALLSAALFGLIGLGFASAKPIPINGIAAKVNGRVITNNQINLQLAPFHRQLITEYPERGRDFYTKLNEARNEIRENLIEAEIILDEYKQLGITIPEAAVDNEIKREINRLYKGDKSKLNEELRKARVTMNRYRQINREKLIIQAMRRSLYDDAAPPLPSEIRKEYNTSKHDMRDTSQDVVSWHKIFIPAKDVRNPAATPQEQLAKAKELADKIRNGEDFAELAKEHSKDAFAENGGFEENKPRGDISAELAAVVFSAKEGQVLGPLESRAGYTIIRPSKIEYGPSPSLSEVRARIMDQVQSKKTNAHFDAWMEKRKKRAIIKRLN